MNLKGYIQYILVVAATALATGCGDRTPTIEIEGDRVAAVAFSSAVSSGEIDIGVETDPDYQRRGLSAKLSLKMCEEIIAMGKKPVWAHAAANVASGKTAERAGFLKTKDNYVIRCS